MNLYSVFQHIAFKFDAEQTHDLTLNLLSKAPLISDLFYPLNNEPKLTLTLNDLSWKFPVGLAAGFDKNAKCINFFDRMGFGASEVGTITKLKQIGNPKPRVFRIKEIASLRNAMGFPNAGSEEILKNIQKSSPYTLTLGANLGKNKDTSEADTPAEYAYLYKMFAPHVNYLVVNISSPNTPGLRSFQKKELLLPIMESLIEERKNLHKPVFIKIAPDMDGEDIKMICELSKEKNFSGIIATNTTIQHDYGKGGLSGDYIKPYATKVRNKVCEYLREDPTQSIIGVGGISTYQEIKDFWKLGGGFTQVYTAYIYHGPGLLKNIQKEILADMKKYQFKTLQEMYQNIKEVD